MNRKMTPILLTVLIALGLITYVSERSASSDGASAAKPGSRVLNVDTADVTQIRVRRDYWNSYTLKRNGDGSWQLLEPSVESASSENAVRVLNALANLPVVTTIDLPSDDSERHREYGLWNPTLELTVTTSAGDHTVRFGTATPDGAGIYCTVAGNDRVYVTRADSLKAVAADPAVFRITSPVASQPAGGLQIEELAPGTGEPLRDGMIALVNYKGMLQDGTEFDSSAKHNRPFPLKVGAGMVIRGWDQGLVGMRVGGKRRLTIPPELAYGERGHPPTIPPNATLIFEVELVTIQPDSQSLRAVPNRPPPNRNGSVSPPG